MRGIFPVAVTLLFLVAGCGKQGDKADPEADGFALSLKVEAPGAQVMRVDLPAAALAAIGRPDKGDIRVMDAHGRPLSMAILEPNMARQARIRLAAIPFESKTEGDHPPPVSVRVDQAGSSVRIRAEGRETSVPGYSVLFDTRTVRDAAIGIALDANLPKQRPVTIAIAAGKDLQTWEPLAERVLLRPGDGPDLLGGNRIVLPPAGLQGRYLRVSWRGEPPVNVTGATLFTSSSPPRPRVAIPASGVEPADAHNLIFSMPPGLRPAAMRVTMTGKDGVVPVRLLGRDNAEAPWRLLAMASLRQGGSGALLEIDGGPAHFYRVEADPRSAGFSRAPAIEFHYAPIALAVAFNGDAPYRLLAGNPAAKPISFALSDLTNQPGSLGEARVTGAQPRVAIEVGNAADASRIAPRTLALWAALLAGVALLAYAAFRLMRASSGKQVD